MNPRRRQRTAACVWRVLYPVGIHFVIAQIIGNLAFFWFVQMTGQGVGAYYGSVVVLTGTTGLFSMLAAAHFYRRDRNRRVLCGVTRPPGRSPMKAGKALLLLVMGAGLAQYGNMLMAIFQIFLKSTAYEESMSQISAGKSIFVMLFWMGIIAPIAEEMIFRWLVYLRLRDYLRMGWSMVISAVLFGVYHGNILQAIYASLLGLAFAYVLEKSGNPWSCVLLHVGANIWSLLLSEYGTGLVERAPYLLVGVVYVVMPAAVIGGFAYFRRHIPKKNVRLV